MPLHDPSTEAMHADDPSPLPWSAALSRLTRSEREVTYWLSTVRADGRPHVVPVAPVWHENTYYFTTGQGTQKGANLAHEARCSVAFSDNGMSLVIEGTASQVTDNATLEQVAALYNEIGWPVSVSGDAFAAPYHAPTTGPAPYAVYRIVPSLVYGLGTTEETHQHSSRYRFAPDQEPAAS